MPVSIDITGVSKNFERVKALDNVSVKINRGELFGFIGPDGAGKTTLFRIITTLLLPDTGTISINGSDVVKDFKDIRKITGYMPGRFSLYMDLTVEENLNFYAEIFKTSVKKNYELIKDIYSHIEPFKKRRAGDLSGGMKQKLALSCALIHKPQILVLDEPTTGVDAVSREEFWNILKKMQQFDITILVSTPYMSEASLCDRIALMQNGKLLSVATPQQVTNDYPYRLFKIKTSSMHKLLADIKTSKEIKSAYRFGEFIHFAVDDNEDFDMKNLKKRLSEKGHADIEMETINPNIEDCFLELMDKEGL
jgi:ABC-type multidrug transport system ATPase subunit